MGVTTLTKKTNDYYCNHCFMKQPKKLMSECIFCGCFFTNFEEILVKDFKEKEQLDRE